MVHWGDRQLLSQRLHQHGYAIKKGHGNYGVVHTGHIGHSAD